MLHLYGRFQQLSLSLQIDQANTGLEHIYTDEQIQELRINKKVGVSK